MLYLWACEACIDICSLQSSTVSRYPEYVPFLTWGLPPMLQIQMFPLPVFASKLMRRGVPLPPRSFSLFFDNLLHLLFHYSAYDHIGVKQKAHEEFSGRVISTSCKINLFLCGSSTSFASSHRGHGFWRKIQQNMPIICAWWTKSTLVYLRWLNRVVSPVD